jgi:hypothetical protein
VIIVGKRDIKFLGRHVMIKGEYVDLVLRGVKRTTIRLGRVKPKYSEVILHGGGRPVAKVKIKKVTYKKVKELTDADAIKDGFKSLTELLRALKETYGNVRDDDYVTIIEFEVVKKIEATEVSDPYLGLEPADIARLALRYLGEEHFTEEELRVLKCMTATASIRLTSIRLYGTLDKRWKVRLTLKKALKMMIEKGVLKVSGKRQR